MQTSYFPYILLSLLLVILVPYSINAQVLSYHLEIDEEQWNSFHVRIVIENVSEDHLTLVLPKWRPGIYIELDSHKFIENLYAYGESADELNVTQLDENKWLIDVAKSSTVRIEYDVDHSTRRFMMSYLNRKYAIVDGALNFMYIMNFKHLPIDINLRVPHGWKVATSLKPSESSFEFIASDYDELIDSPMLLSNFDEYYFTLDRYLFYVIINGDITFDMNKFLVMIKRVVEYQGSFFNDYPFDRYLFLIDVQPQGRSGGGLEHGKSSLIILSKELLKQDMNRAANIISHEFFHSWNVKQIYPEVFSSSDYMSPGRTENLWFVEGVTSYYADLTLIRTGIWSERDYLDNQARLIKQIEENPDRLVTSLEEASLSIWENGYLHRGISFYDKGQVVALLLDLSIRQGTNNHRSMDDVMRFMNVWFAEHDQGFQEGDILRAVNAISGIDHTVFFNKYISGTVPLPYEDYLHYAGISAQIIPDLDLFELNETNHTIASIDSMSAFYKAGLRSGDVIELINNQSISDRKSLLQALADVKSVKPVTIRFSRGGKEQTMSMDLEMTHEVAVELDFLPEPNDLQSRIRNSLLNKEVN